MELSVVYSKYRAFPGSTRRVVYPEEATVGNACVAKMFPFAIAIDGVIEDRDQLLWFNRCARFTQLSSRDMRNFRKEVRDDQ